MKAEPPVEPCSDEDEAEILAIINQAAERYRGAIPPDCFHQPYMSAADLARERAAGVEFWGVRDGGALIGVMGIQKVRDVRLIRHAYVRPEAQGRGIGGAMLARLTDRPGRILIGTWADAHWAIAFYRKHGFDLVPAEQARALLADYWTIPARQAEVSVVLARAE